MLLRFRLIGVKVVLLQPSVLSLTCCAGENNYTSNRTHLPLIRDPTSTALYSESKLTRSGLEVNYPRWSMSRSRLRWDRDRGARRGSVSSSSGSHTRLSVNTALSRAGTISKTNTATHSRNVFIQLRNVGQSFSWETATFHVSVLRVFTKIDQENRCLRERRMIELFLGFGEEPVSGMITEFSGFKANLWQ